MLFFIKKLPKIRYSCWFQGFSKASEFSSYNTNVYFFLDDFLIQFPSNNYCNIFYGLMFAWLLCSSNLINKNWKNLWNRWFYCISCRFAGFSKHTRFCLLYSFCFSLPLIEKWDNKSQNQLFMQVCGIF